MSVKWPQMILRQRSDLVIGLLIFVASASLYILLRTQQYLVEDAIRCLSVYWQGRPTTAGNNHLLCLVNVFAWTKMLSLAGVNATNPFDFMRIAHWMTAIAAAACISMFWLLCRRATGSIGIALAATCAYGFSNAFLVHATSTAEPMTGLFWTFASIAMVAWGLSVSSRLRLFVGGALLLLAMANYESMVLIGPAELVLIYYWDELPGYHGRTFALWFLAGCLFGGIAAYVPAYALSGTTHPLAMWHRFVEMGGEQQVFGGFAASKLINLPVGFSNSILSSLPLHYQGVRASLAMHSHDRWILLTSIAILMLLGWLVWTLRRLRFVWPELERRQRLILTCCAVAIGLEVFPLIFWEPIYNKLWLQPLAVIFFAWSLIFTAWRRHYPGRLMFVPEALLLAVVLGAGFTSAFAASRSPMPCLGAARQLSETLRPTDLLVGEWDPVSLLYASFWGDGAKRFDLPGIAGENGPRTPTLLDDEILRVRNSGGRVYALGVVDMPEANWNLFLQSRCRLPYSSLAEIRRCAKPVEHLVCGEGDEVLWQVSLDCYKPQNPSGNLMTTKP